MTAKPIPPKSAPQTKDSSHPAADAAPDLAGDDLPSDQIADSEVDSDDEATLPDLDNEDLDDDAEDSAWAEEMAADVAQADVADNVFPSATPGAIGRGVIAHATKHAPGSPGVYRMLNATRDVLYVGKAKNLRKRLTSYTRATGHTHRIARMIAMTHAVEIVTTATETEALLLEANLIKKLLPRFNVLLRDDKSFPYILITSDHWAPQILKHRGAQTRPGRYFGPFASVLAVNRAMTALQRAFMLRSCTDSFFESRTRPCLLFQIKRCAGPCTQEIDYGAYAELVNEAKDFLSGRSRAVKQFLATEMEKAANDLEFERAALYRDRIAALSTIQSQQGINPQTIVDADVFAIHQEGGYSCIEVFFFRTGQNWGNRAYFPRADRSLPPGEVLGPFLAQFYASKPPPRLILLSHDVPEHALLTDALSLKAEHRVEISVPARGEKKTLVAHALNNAREALGRKLAESASQARLLDALARTLHLAKTPQRIEVYDNSHLQGKNAVGAMIVAGPEGFQKNQYRKFNMQGGDLAPGDDYGMMRQMLERRFKRLLQETPPPSSVSPPDADDEDNASLAPRWPDLLIIDGGEGQLAVTHRVLDELGVAHVEVIAVAKGPDRDAGRETIFRQGAPPLRLEPRDPVLYFIQRLRDEAHRFVIGSHRVLRKKDVRETGLQEIAGIGPARKRALLHHFGTLKAIESASLADLSKVEGINEEMARKIFAYFHAEAT